MIEYLVVTYTDFMWTPVKLVEASDALELLASDKQDAPECVSRLFVVGRSLL